MLLAQSSAPIVTEKPKSAQAYFQCFSKQETPFANRLVGTITRLLIFSC
jgi:hypothetical protein